MVTVRINPDWGEHWGTDWDESQTDLAASWAAYRGVLATELAEALGEPVTVEYLPAGDLRSYNFDTEAVTLEAHDEIGDRVLNTMEEVWTAGEFWCPGAGEWKPTHRITLDDGRTIEVMVQHDHGVEGGAPAYAREEWETDDSTDYTVEANGDWLFQGEAFAGIVQLISRPDRTPRGLAFLNVNLYVTGHEVRFRIHTQRRRDVQVLEIELDGRIGHGVTLYADRDQLAALRDTLTGHLESIGGTHGG